MSSKKQRRPASPNPQTYALLGAARKYCEAKKIKATELSRAAAIPWDSAERIIHGEATYLKSATFDKLKGWLEAAQALDADPSGPYYPPVPPATPSAESVETPEQELARIKLELKEARMLLAAYREGRL